jgi:hypothetical protein
LSCDKPTFSERKPQMPAAAQLATASVWWDCPMGCPPPTIRAVSTQRPPPRPDHPLVRRVGCVSVRRRALPVACRRDRRLRLERRPVLLACLFHVLLPRHRRFLGAGLHLNQLSRFRGPVQLAAQRAHRARTLARFLLTRSPHLPGRSSRDTKGEPDAERRTARKNGDTRMVASMGREG